MNPSRAIGSLHPQVTRTILNNCKIFDLVIRVLPCHGKIKNETGNILENLRDKIVFKNSERKDNFNVETFWHKNSVNRNHTKSNLNYNQNYSDLINVDLNHTNSDQPTSDNSTNIGSIHDSDNILERDKTLASPVHYMVHASPIYFCMVVHVTSLRCRMTHWKKAYHLEETRIHVNIHPIRYQTYHLTQIQIQDCHIVLRKSHLNHQTTSIINKDNA